VRWFSLMLVMSVACDDVVFPGGGTEYTPDWLGTQVFFSDSCVSCHPSVSDAIDLPSDIFSDVCNETGFWVVPGDPDASLLWRLVAGTNTEEDPPVMPFGTGPLPASQTDFLREWIAQGALIEECP